MATPICDESQQNLEKRLFKLYEEQDEMRNHPNFPWVSDIPGWKFTEDEIDRIETELAERCCFGQTDGF